MLINFVRRNSRNVGRMNDVREMDVNWSHWSINYTKSHRKPPYIHSRQFSFMFPLILAKDDSLVRAAIQTIPEEAAKRGVFPEDTLRERFLKVITAFPTFFRIRIRLLCFMRWSLRSLCDLNDKRINIGIIYCFL